MNKELECLYEATASFRERYRYYRDIPPYCRSNDDVKTMSCKSDDRMLHWLITNRCTEFALSVYDKNEQGDKTMVCSIQVLCATSRINITTSLPIGKVEKAVKGFFKWVRKNCIVENGRLLRLYANGIDITAAVNGSNT